MNRMADDIGPFLTKNFVAERLAVTTEEVDARTKTRNLIALTTVDDVTVYPAFQFAGREVNATAIEAWCVWDDLGWAGALWLLTPNEHLDDMRRIDCSGDPADVIEAALYDTPDDAYIETEEVLADPNLMQQIRESRTSADPPEELTRDDFPQHPRRSDES